MKSPGRFFPLVTCRAIMAVSAIMTAMGSATAQDSPPPPAGEREFSVRSSDGTQLTGVVDTPRTPSPVAVIMVAGTGLFDRDVEFGKSGTEADKLFKDIGWRFAAKGLLAVRYDRRGVQFGQPADKRLDRQVSGSSTVVSQVEDLAAIYRWAVSSTGLAAKCVVFFGHSEGTLHVARLANSGAPAPLAVIGMGAVMASPQAVVRWQLSQRDAFSLREMDVDRDGNTSAAEVNAHWRETPSSVFETITPLLPPNGRAWSKQDILQVEAAQADLYEQAKDAALKLDDAAPYPNAIIPMARSSWWKNWFTDEVPGAQLLSKWPRTVISLHWGSIDSQTPPTLNQPAARKWLGRRAKITIHPGLGHSLGRHPLFGPMAPHVAEAIAKEVSTIARRCL